MDGYDLCPIYSLKKCDYKFPHSTEETTNSRTGESSQANNTSSFCFDLSGLGLRVSYPPFFALVEFCQHCFSSQPHLIIRCRKRVSQCSIKNCLNFLHRMDGIGKKRDHVQKFLGKDIFLSHSGKQKKIVT